MKIKELRKKYPQYDDIGDEKFAEWLYESRYKDQLPKESFMTAIGIGIQEPSTTEVILPKICEMKETLHSDLVSTIKKLDDMSKLMLKIADEINSLHKSIDKIQFEAPEIEFPEIQIPQTQVNIPEPVKQWKFDVVRDRNGFISEVVARA